MVDYSYPDIAKMIDHSLLQPALTVEQLELGCSLAVSYRVASVCIMPYYLKRCAELLSGSGVKASTTIGFPHGGHATDIKIAETYKALADGGEELDMVVNISKVLSGDWDYVQKEITEIVTITHKAGQKVKVIFENYYLKDEHKIKLCEICGNAKADWVKTSTGYAVVKAGENGGATDHDLRLMRQHSPKHVQVKAAGGVRDLDRLLLVKSFGVTRVGASATQAILDEARGRLGMTAIQRVEPITGEGY